MIQRTLAIKECTACQGCGKSNLAKAVQTDCKTCKGTGIVADPNAKTRETIRQMLTDWDAATDEQRADALAKAAKLAEGAIR